MNIESLEQFSFFFFMDCDIFITELKIINISLNNSILFQIESEQINKSLSIFQMRNSIIEAIFCKNLEMDSKNKNQRLLSLILVAKKNYVLLFDSLIIEKCYSSIYNSIT